MRVLLIGSAAEREELRIHTEELGIAVDGEYRDGGGGARIGRAGRRDPDPAPRAHAANDTRLVEPLTSRETEVLELLAEGLSNKGIAARLGISDQTVKFHVASIGGKLGAANRTDAVRLAVRRGLIAL